MLRWLSYFLGRSMSANLTRDAGDHGRLRVVKGRAGRHIDLAHALDAES